MDPYIQFLSGINEGLRVPLPESRELSLGRNPTNDLVLSGDAWVSGSHASVKRQQGRYYLRDLDSKNGSYLGKTRIPALSYRPVDGPFVVGSTLFLFTEKPAVLVDGPIELTALLSRPGEISVLQAAVVHAQSSPVITSVHVLLALLDRYPTQLAPFFEALKKPINPDGFREHALSHHFFEGHYAWLNPFLVLPAQVQNGERYVTPLAQLLLNERDRPLLALRNYLAFGFSLAYPLLKWERNETAWERFFKRLPSAMELMTEPLMCADTTVPTRHEQIVASTPVAQEARSCEELDVPAPDEENASASIGVKSPLPLTHAPASAIATAELSCLDANGDFVQELTERVPQVPSRPLPPYLHPLMGPLPLWQDLANAVESGRPILLTGPVGSGKSALIQCGLRNRAKADLPSSLLRPLRLFDPKAHFFFMPDHTLRTYVNDLIITLAQPTLTVVDHVTYLLIRMVDLGIERDPLLEAVRNAKGPVVLVAEGASRGDLEEALPGLVVLDFEPSQASVFPQMIQALVDEFQDRVQALVSPRAQQYFYTFLAQHGPGNIRLAHELNELAIQRAQVLSEELLNLGEQTSALKNLDEHCFRGVVDEWFQSHPEAGHSRSTVDPLERPTSALLDQIETLFHQFARSQFKTALSYSDRTQSLQQPGTLSREAKLEEFKVHLIHLIMTYQNAFPTWFHAFWQQIDPAELRRKTGSNRSRALWDAYEEQTRHMDTAYAEDLFHAVGEQLLKDALDPRRMKSEAEEP